MEQASRTCGTRVGLMKSTNVWLMMSCKLLHGTLPPMLFTLMTLLAGTNTLKQSVFSTSSTGKTAWRSKALRIWLIRTRSGGPISGVNQMLSRSLKKTSRTTRKQLVSLYCLCRPAGNMATTSMREKLMVISGDSLWADLFLLTQNNHRWLVSNLRLRWNLVWIDQNNLLIHHLCNPTIRWNHEWIMSLSDKSQLSPWENLWIKMARSLCLRDLLILSKSHEQLHPMKMLLQEWRDQSKEKGLCQLVEKGKDQATLRDKATKIDHPTRIDPEKTFHNKRMQGRKKPQENTQLNDVTQFSKSDLTLF